MSEQRNTEPQEPSPANVNASTTRAGSRVVIIGGGPGGYEAALTARQLGADVTVVEQRGAGGSAVLTDVVPSKTLIASAEWLSSVESAGELGIVTSSTDIHADLTTINARVRQTAAQQSSDIHNLLLSRNIRVITGRGRIASGMKEDGSRDIEVTTDNGVETIEADMILLATGAQPRELETAKPDGKRILTWAQMYDLEEVPTHLIVVGSGVTGAEFASAYNQLDVPVTLVSSRQRVLPGQDPDAAELIEGVFNRRGMNILSGSRAQAARATDDGVEVELSDGRVITGSHCLMAVGAIPNTEDLGLAQAGVELTETGHIKVDRVSRTTAFRIYAAGDVTGVLPLASVAAMQGRVAMNHALGDTVSPLRVHRVTANIFTSPEIATVGCSQEDIDSGVVDVVSTTLPLARNPRAKMRGIKEGFIKLYADRSSRIIQGGVIVAPGASELILPVALAVSNNLTVDHVAKVFTIYPSLSGSTTEAARQLHDSGE